MKCVTFALLSALLISGSGPEPKRVDAKVPPLEVLAIRLQKTDGYENFYDGTRVSAYFQMPGHFIVGIDASNSKIKFTDDTTANLLETDRGDAKNITDTRIARDGSAAALTFRAPRLPAKKASKVLIQCDFVVLVGKKEKVIELKEVSLEDSLDLKIGALKRSKTGSLRDRLYYFEGKAPLKGIEVLDREGKVLPFRLNSRFDSQVGEKAGFKSSLHFTAPKKQVLDRCTLRATYFEAIERITVPVDLSVGLGF